MRQSGVMSIDDIVPVFVRWMLRAVVVLALVHIARLGAQHRLYFEDAAWRMATMQPLLWQSGWGLAWLIGAASLLIAFAGIKCVGRSPSTGWALLTTAIVSFAWTMAMSGIPPPRRRTRPRPSIHSTCWGQAGGLAAFPS